MILIPVEEDEKSIAKGFRKSDMFVFIDPETGIVVQENHYKKDNSELFFENFKNYDVDAIFLKGLGYKTFLKLQSLDIEVSLIPEDIEVYTYIDPNDLILLSDENAELYCTMGHHDKDVD